MSTSTTNLPLLYWSIQLSAAPSSDGTLRASSLPIRTALPWICFWIFSGVNDSRSAARASVTAASPRSMSNDRARAVSSAWMTALIARVSWLSSLRPLLKTADRNAPSAIPERSRLAVDQVLAGEAIDVVAVALPR